MYIEIYWFGPTIDPDTGVPSSEGGRYTKLKNLSFAPQADLTGNSLPINEYSVDIITTDAIPVEALTVTLYDERGLPWAYWPLSKVQRLAPNCVRVTARSWLANLDHIKLEAVMYEDEPASDAIATCFGAGSRDYSINPTIAAKTVSGYAPEQTARERLTWLMFVLGAFPVDTYREDVRITEVDETPALVPLDRTFSRPKVDRNAWVTGLKITTYSFREGSQEEWEADRESQQFPAPWIVTTGTVTLSNPNAPGGVPANVVEIDNIYLINPDNVSDVLSRLAKYWFNPVSVQLDCINNRKYRPGDMLQVYTGLDSMATGYVQQASFSFGKQARSRLTLTGATALPLAKLTVVYTHQGKRIGKKEYYLPVGVAFEMDNPYLDQTKDDQRRVYRPTTATVEGTMPEGGMTVNVVYDIALELSEGVLHIISVDEVTEESSGGAQIGVIA